MRDVLLRPYFQTVNSSSGIFWHHQSGPEKGRVDAGSVSSGTASLSQVMYLSQLRRGAIGLTFPFHQSRVLVDLGARILGSSSIPVFA